MSYPRRVSSFFAPVPAETRAALARAWQRVPAALRTPRQFLGRQYAGCGALIGAMPRCDFACRGCYLGADANRAPALPLAELEAQMKQLREWLGEGGNLQLTDGEVALRDPDELVAMVRHALQIGLVPMLMTHGEGLRRNPALLRRLMVEGGLREVSLHIDTTQRGRRDAEFRYARFEAALHPLRDEFAALVRRLRRETGRPLEVATTVTVTRENLGGVADVVRWIVANADAFKMASFQPIARVGRTQEGIAEAVSVEELWEQIEKGLGTAWRGERSLSEHHGWLGHPDCSRFVQGLVHHAPDHAPRFTPLLDPADPAETRLLGELLDRLGGLTFRLDSPGAAARRMLAALGALPARSLARLLAQLWVSARRFAPEGRLRALRDLTLGRARVHYLNLVSHQFMSAQELATERGRERVALCAFQVPVNGELRSMCEVNALGLRDDFYAELRTRPMGFAPLAIPIGLTTPSSSEPPGPTT